MEFQSKVQEDTYNKVLPWMKEIFGDFCVPRTDHPSFATYVGSAYASTAVSPWGDDEAIITTRSWVVTGVELTQELLQYLLRENDTRRFGAFGLDTDNDIFYEHTIVGSTCDRAELKTSVMAVILAADDYDDKISQRWGGTRSVDRGKS
jgi:hypothetical protein